LSGFFLEGRSLWKSFEHKVHFAAKARAPNPLPIGNLKVVPPLIYKCVED